MIITLSPAKLLDFQSPINTKNASTPLFANEAKELNRLLQKLTKGDIASLMKINPNITMQVYEYIHTFETNKTPERQAIFAFNGIAYQGLDADTLTDQSLDFAQEHLISLSGLYGVIRPLDKIKPYRLEMGRELKNPRGNRLYDFWSDLVTEYLSKQLLADDNIWINCASNEYAKVINKKNLPKDCQIITPQFKEINGDKFKQVVVYSKKARGMLARFIIENQIKDLEHVKAFDYEGYSFSPQLSTDKEWTFIR